MAISCERCGYGYNPDDAQTCTMCGKALGRVDGRGRPRLSETGRGGVTASTPPLRRPSRPGRVSGSGGVKAASPAAPRPPAVQPRANTISGRISHLERHDEAPPVNVYGVLARILIILLVLVPYGILFVFSAVLAFAFAFLGFPSLSQLFNPIIWTTSMFELLEVIVLRRIRGVNTVPVYRGSVEDNQGRERAFMFRGPLNSANMVLGHHVTLSGKWERDTFMIRRGRDHTTNAVITSGYRNPWRAAFFVVLFLHIFFWLTVCANWGEILTRLG